MNPPMLQDDPTEPGSDVHVWRDSALDGAYLVRARYGAHEFERHLHNEMVIAVTEEGAGKCWTRHGSDISAPRTVWVFAPGEYHCGNVWEDRQWNYRGIYVDSAGLLALSGILMDDRHTEMRAAPGLYNDPQLANVLVHAHQGEEQNLPDMQKQARWCAAMGILFGRYGRPKSRLDAVGNEKSKMARVRDYIAANFLRNMSIDELLPLCGLSRYHLMRSFAREYGMPPHAYANQLRLLEAKRLIDSGSRPADAAVSAGFYDQSHLTHLFKRAYGITPGAYSAMRPKDATTHGACGRQSR
jgi:AraC-like DNA-binding protein